MAADEQPRRALPTEPLECRQNAEAALVECKPPEAIAWALLAVTGQLTQLINLQRRR